LEWVGEWEDPIHIWEVVEVWVECTEVV